MWWLDPAERRLPWWMHPRPCATCGRRAWRWCLLCGRRCCRGCRIGHGWVWCCPDRQCRAGFARAKRELRQLRLMEKTLFCLVCGARFSRQLASVLERTGPDDVLELCYLVLQHPACSCPPMTEEQRRKLERFRRRHPGGDGDDG